MAKSMVKNGSFYREKEGGGALLKIRKAGVKPKAKAPQLSLSERARKDPALLERAMADPGLRSRLADSQLTPAYRVQRDDRIFKEDLNDPTTGLSGKSALRVGEQLVDREDRSARDAIGRQERKVDASRDLQQRGNTDRYAAINGIFKGSHGAQVAANTGAVDASKQAQLDQLAVVDEVQRQAAERASADTAARGEGLDGGAGAALAEQAAQAKLRVAAAGQSRTADTSSRGQTQAAFIQGLGVATQARGGEQSGDINARAFNDLSELQGDRRKLREGRDGKLTDTLLKIRGGEVDRHLTERGLSTQAEKAVLDAKVELAKLKSRDQIDRWKANLSATLQREGMGSREAIATADRVSRDANAELGRAQSDRNNRRSNSDKGEGGISRAKRLTHAQNRDKTFGYARSLKQQGVKGKDARSALSDKGYDALFVQAAIEKYWGGRGVTPGTSSKIKDTFGIDIPRGLR